MEGEQTGKRARQGKAAMGSGKEEVQLGTNGSLLLLNEKDER